MFPVAVITNGARARDTMENILGGAGGDFMKVMFCLECGTIRSFTAPYHKWVLCDCGYMAARWIDPTAGTVEVLVRTRRTNNARFIGLNNSMLRHARQGGLNEDWRTAHEAATDAPGYIFDKSCRNCWACIVTVGQTNDINYHALQQQIDSREITFEKALELTSL